MAEADLSIAGLRSVFVLNPVSGRLSKRGNRREQIEAFIRAQGLDARVEVTGGPREATQIAREAVKTGAELIVSVGGDGTMNEVAQALVNTPTLYGMVPTGSGNGLARDLGLPLTVDGALRGLLAARVRVIDTGQVDGHAFFNVMGLGFDAEIGRRFNQSRNRGFLSYLGITLRSVLSFRHEQLRVAVDGGEEVSINAFIAAVANSTQYGNNARIAPRARLDDGRLDLAAVLASHPLAALVLGVRMFAGSIDRSRWLLSRQGARVTINRLAPGPIHTDGEIHLCGERLEVSVVPASLRVLVPVAKPDPGVQRASGD